MHTERSYVERIVRFVRFHGMRSREDLFPAEPRIESFLTGLAVNGNVAAATQNQQQLLGHNDVASTMIYAHILQQGGQGVPSPLDDLGV